MEYTKENHKVIESFKEILWQLPKFFEEEISYGKSLENSTKVSKMSANLSNATTSILKVATEINDDIKSIKELNNKVEEKIKLTSMQ